MPATTTTTRPSPSAEIEIVEIQLSGKLTKDDYEAFVPGVELRLEAADVVRMVVVLRDFHGWTAGALWEDIKFDAKHFKDIDRLAIVGEEKWQSGMVAFCKPFTTADVRFFPARQLADARAWASE